MVVHVSLNGAARSSAGAIGVLYGWQYLQRRHSRFPDTEPTCHGCCKSGPARVARGSGAHVERSIISTATEVTNRTVKHDIPPAADMTVHSKPMPMHAANQIRCCLGGAVRQSPVDICRDIATDVV